MDVAALQLRGSVLGSSLDLHGDFVRVAGTDIEVSGSGCVRNNRSRCQPVDLDATTACEHEVQLLCGESLHMDLAAAGDFNGIKALHAQHVSKRLLSPNAV